MFQVRGESLRVKQRELLRAQMFDQPDQAIFDASVTPMEH
jgi:hypothetical protein